jgi:hypothetical protein
MSDVAALADQIGQANINDDDDKMSSVSGSDKSMAQQVMETGDAMLKTLATITKELQEVKAQLAMNTMGAAAVAPKQPNRESNIQKWNSKITETGLFKLTNGMSVFSTNASRLIYVRLLCNFFYAQTEDPDYDVLFAPANNYENFRELLLLCPVPMDHEGFYLNNPMRMHLNSQHVSPNRAQHALMRGAATPPVTTFAFGAGAAH